MVTDQHTLMLKFAEFTTTPTLHNNIPIIGFLQSTTFWSWQGVEVDRPQQPAAMRHGIGSGALAARHDTIHLLRLLAHIQSLPFLAHGLRSITWNPKWRWIAPEAC